MPLISDYEENTYSSNILKKLIKLLPPSTVPIENIHIDFESGITLSGLEALKETFHELKTSIPETSGTKTMYIWEILDPQSEDELDASILQHYIGVMGYRIYTKKVYDCLGASLKVWLWKESTDLVYPLEAKAEVKVVADDKNA